MKTMTLKFVVEDEGAPWLEERLVSLMEKEMEDLPVVGLMTAKSTAEDEAWMRRRVEELNGEGGGKAVILTDAG